MDGARRKTIGRDGWCLITLVCFFPPVRNPPSSFSSTRSLDSRLTQHKSYANKGALCKSSYLLSFLCISRSSTRYRVLIVPMHVFVRKPFLMNRIRFIHRCTWSEENLFELYVKIYARRSWDIIVAHVCQISSRSERKKFPILFDLYLWFTTGWMLSEYLGRKPCILISWDFIDASRRIDETSLLFRNIPWNCC